MPRLKKDAAIDLTVSHPLTNAMVEVLICPEGRAQAFLRDSKTPGLQVRVTPNGVKSFIFESRVDGKTMRRTIGSAIAWSVDRAREDANKLRVLIDSGKDPREIYRLAQEVKAFQRQEAEALVAQEATQAVTVGSLWPRYMAEGKPIRKDTWKPRYVIDLKAMVAPGGVPRVRGVGVTMPGHLWPLMAYRLKDLDHDVIREWFLSESKRSSVQSQRALAMLGGFLRWCSTQKALRGMVNRDAAKAEQLADLLPKKVKRTDALELAQLEGWFSGTDKLRSPMARAYLQGLVLTGARRVELAALRWQDVDFKWKKLVLNDKVSVQRVIPLSAYFESLIAGLPRALLADGEPNPYVFSSTGRTGHIAEPRSIHEQVLLDAQIPHTSIHGLRRTFAQMGEAAGAPAGAIAQVMGHAPNSISESYKVRSIDALRPHLAKIEAFILDTAGIKFDPSAPAVGGLRLVKTAA